MGPMDVFQWAAALSGGVFLVGISLGLVASVVKTIKEPNPRKQKTLDTSRTQVRLLSKDPEAKGK